MSVGIIMPVQFTGSFKMDEPHCTLIYLGKSMHHSRRNILENAVQRLRMQVTPKLIPVTGLAVFGHGDHTVMKLETEILKSWRAFIEKELRHDGITSASEWAYNPHVTINKHEHSEVPVPPWEGWTTPSSVWLDRPTLMWK